MVKAKLQMQPLRVNINAHMNSDTMGMNRNTELPVIDPQICGGKIVLVRVDFNVPMYAGRVQDPGRLLAVDPTLKALQKAGARIVLLAHMGRPKGVNPALSNVHILQDLKDIYGQGLKFCNHTTGNAVREAISQLHAGEILLVENLRFDPREEENDPSFAKELAALGDIYVNDAFAVSHRAHASVDAITHYLPSFAGLLLNNEIHGIQEALSGSKKPIFCVLGGSKISTKLQLVQKLAKVTDGIALMGGLAHTFLKVQGFEIGKSIWEADMQDQAKSIIESFKASGQPLILPVDCRIERPDHEGLVVHVNEVQPGDCILDVGPQTIALLANQLQKSKALLWNGPLGFFEKPPFDQGTQDFMQAVKARMNAGNFYSLAGGGETLAAIRQKGFNDSFSYMSTGGGAFLEYLELGTLPGIQALLSQ